MKRLAKVLSLAIFTAFFLLMLVRGSAYASTEKILHNFNLTPNGQQPNGGLISDAAGNLYGTTLYGGTYSFGAVYELTPNSKGGWVETLLYSFTGAADGNGPIGTLVFDTAGNLYGGTIGGGSQLDGVIFKLTPHKNAPWTESVLWNFHGADGVNSNGGMIFDQAGNLYGTTSNGGGLGRQTCINLGCGTAFRLTPGTNGKWTLTTLYRFQGAGDGANPKPNLAIDHAGNLYGTTSTGGVLGTGLGHGVVFELTPGAVSWTETVLYAFTGGTDGGYPASTVIFDQSGNLYTTTAVGGSGTGCDNPACGAVVELSPASGGLWTETVIYSFNGSDGQTPVGNLVFDRASNLYGTTSAGGGVGDGTVFQLTHGSGGQWTQSVLWSFTGGTDGRNPTFGVTLGSSGQIYGALTASGVSNGNGTVFALLPAQGGAFTETTLTSFLSGNGHPLTGLVADGAGNFYGATNQGASHGFGGVYKLSPAAGGAWTVTILYNFTSGLANSPYGPSPSTLTFDSSGQSLWRACLRRNSRTRYGVRTLACRRRQVDRERSLYVYRSLRRRLSVRRADLRLRG